MVNEIWGLGMSRCLIQPSLAVITPEKPSYLLPFSVYRFNVPSDQRERNQSLAHSRYLDHPLISLYIDDEGQKSAPKQSFRHFAVRLLEADPAYAASQARIGFHIEEVTLDKINTLFCHSKELLDWSGP